MENLASLADDIPKENPDLSYDISWVVYDDFIAIDAASLRQWAAPIEKYAARFMLGTGKVGRWDTYPKNQYAPLITLLDEEHDKARLLYVIPVM